MHTGSCDPRADPIQALKNILKVLIGERVKGQYSWAHNYLK